MVGVTFEISLRGLRKFAFGGYCFLHLRLLLCFVPASQAFQKRTYLLAPTNCS